MAQPSYRRILVPVDFSLCSRLAFEHAHYLASRLDGASIDALHVWAVPSYVDTDLTIHGPGVGPRTILEFARSRAQEDMTTFLEGLPKDVPVAGKVEHGDPVEAVIAASKDGGYDLVVMGTHGRTGLTHMLMGSVAERVVRRSACPVLTVRHPGE